MKVLRVLLSLAVSALVLCLGAYAGGAFSPAQAAAHPAPAPLPQGAQRYDHESTVAGEIPIGDALEVNGQPMQLSVFYTSDTPERVIAFYMQAFLERGLIPVTSEGHVSVFDPKDGLQRFISALPDVRGQTLVMLGLTNPRHAPRLLGGAKHAGFPVPDEGRAFLGYRSEDEGARAESGQFVTSQTVAQVAAFYREKLASDGYREKPDSPSLLEFEKQGATLTVGVQALEDKSGAAVFVNRMEGDATR